MQRLAGVGETRLSADPASHGRDVSGARSRFRATQLLQQLRVDTLRLGNVYEWKPLEV